MKTVNYAKELAISDGKLPPSAVDFEKLVLGTLMLDKNAINTVVKRLPNDDSVFFDPKNSLIYKAILTLHDGNFPVDLMTVIQQLKRENKLQEAGGDNYIIDLSMGVSSSANLDYHLFVVLEKYLARQMINVCQSMINKIRNEDVDVLKEIDNHVENINEIEEIIARQRDTPSALELHKQLIAQQQQKIIPGIPSKHRSIEKRMSGYRNGNLVIVAARPAMGKTTYVLDDVFDMAKRGEPVGFFSLEMSASELHQKMVSNETEIAGNALRDRTLGEMDFQKLYETNTFDKLPFFIVDNVFDLNQIMAKSRIMKKEKGVKIIVVDYLQLIEYNAKGLNREQIISTISRKMKQLAKELDIPVIVLSQLSRAVEQRPGKRPQLSDLRESGAIEQDADIVAFLYRPEYYKIAEWDREWDGENDLPTKNEVEVIYAKFRGGGVFEERLKFRGDFSKFYDINTDFSDGYNNPVPFATLEDAFGKNEGKIDEDEEFSY